jgi:hypothetical protein
MKPIVFSSELYILLLERSDFLSQTEKLLSQKNVFFFVALQNLLFPSNDLLEFLFFLGEFGSQDPFFCLKSILDVPLRC